MSTPSHSNTGYTLVSRAASDYLFVSRYDMSAYVLDYDIRVAQSVAGARYAWSRIRGALLCLAKGDKTNEGLQYG